MRRLFLAALVGFTFLFGGCTSDAERQAQYMNAPQGSVLAACRDSGIPTYQLCMCRLMPKSCPR